MQNKDCSSRERWVVIGHRYVAFFGLRARLMMLCLLLLAGVPVVKAAEGPLSAPVSPEGIPSSLVPWIPWVLKGAEQTQCPRVMGLKAVFQCQWPGRLRLVMGADGMRFTQHWTLYRADWVPLPGSREHWPEQVRVDGQDAPLIDRDGVPSLWLEKGGHDIEGLLGWQVQPQMIQLPALHGLIQLKGAASDDPGSVVQLDAKDRLWLQRSGDGQASGQPEHLQVQVFRKLDDDIPLRLATRIRLIVSGGSREVRLGRALPAGFELLSFDSPLPARIDNEGILRVQVKPGDWRLTFNARAVTDQPFLGPKPVTPNWPQAEIWSFAAHPALRSVTLQGGKALDPTQVPVPAAWASLPAYQLAQGDHLTLKPLERAKTLQQDRLHLLRTVWLDFSGQGATINDRLTGTLHGSRRLALSDAMRPGRIDLDGRPQLITRQDGGSAAGVEVRHRQLNLDVVSRLTSGPRGWEWQLPVNGWLSTLDDAQLRVELPPGWRLLGVSGAGHSRGDWLGQWRIWDIFVVLLLGVVAWRVLGISWGLIALVTGALVYPERPDAVGILLTAILVSALAREVSQGRMGVFLRGLRWLALVGLAAVTLMTVVHQVRLAVYPQLGGRLTAKPAAAEIAGAPRAKLKAAADATRQMLSRSTTGPAAMQSEPQPLPDWDPDAKVQTGPGVPTWAWRPASLSWRGPVDPAQFVTLYVLGPVATALMRILMSAGLLLLLLACLLDRRRSSDGSGPGPGHRRREEAEGESWDSEPTSDGVGVAGGVARHGVGAALLLALMLLPGLALGQGFPDQSLLNQLRERVLAPPKCQPHCASERQTQVVLDGFDLTVTEEVSTLARVAWPLPASRDAWQPDAVYVDGTRQDALRFNHDGYLELVLAPGNHEIVLEGKVAEKDALTLAFAEQPHRFSMKVRDWIPLGLVDGRPASKTLRFERQKISERRAERRTTLFQPPPAPFVRIERTLTLGQHWTLTTQVERVAPKVGGIDLPVALMAGERVITPGIEVGKDGAVQIVMGPHDQVVTWQSRLKPVSRLQLTASQGSDRVDVWRLRAGPQWHVETEGVAPSQTYASDGALAPVWHPLPGQTLVMTLSRPGAILGQTLTVDQVGLQWQPEDKGSRLQIQMAVRTSLGGPLQWALPKGLQIRGLSVDGRERPLAKQSNLLDVSLKPGTHRLTVRVDGAQDLSALWHTPILALPWPVTNLNSGVQLPADRWLLWAGGPGIGPAVLYWGILPVLIVLALVLGRHRGNPLGMGSWLLLGVGLSFASPWTALALMAWFYALGWRSRHPDLAVYWQFNLRQVALVLLTLVAFWGLFGGISQGLLGHPDMWVSGNGSRAGLLRWYLDRAAPADSPQWDVVTLPLWVYRGFMLIWSLWLAVKAVSWLRWGWQILVQSGGWRQRPKKQVIEP